MNYLAIDPDTIKSGIAWINGKTLECGAFDFFDVIDTIKEIDNVHVIIEAGWLIKKSNWHNTQSKYAAERISKNVGMCHQVGRLFELFCKKNGIKYELVIPRRSKYTRKFIESQTGLKIKNQDIIDAVGLLIDKNIFFEIRK